MRKTASILLCAAAIASCSIGNKPSRGDALKQIGDYMNNRATNMVIDISDLTYANGSAIDENNYEVDVSYKAKIKDSQDKPSERSDEYVFKKTENGWLLQGPKQ